MYHTHNKNKRGKMKNEGDILSLSVYQQKYKLNIDIKYFSLLEKERRKND